MSTINCEFQFQLLHLRATFCFAYYSVIDNVGHGNAYGVASLAAYHAACHVTSYAASHASYDVACNAVDENNLDDTISTSFKEVFKLDNKIQENIRSKVMVKIPKHYKLPKTESELIGSLLMVENVSKMIPIVQMYWLHSIYYCIESMTNGSDRENMMIKFKNIIMVDEYKHLLKTPMIIIRYLDCILIPPLVKIVEDYYGFMEREALVCELINQ